MQKSTQTEYTQQFSNIVDQKSPDTDRCPAVLCHHGEKGKWGCNRASSRITIYHIAVHVQNAHDVAYRIFCRATLNILS